MGREDLAVGVERSAVGARILTGDPSREEADAFLSRYREIWTPIDPRPREPIVKVRDGVRMVYLQDGREKQLELLRELARSIGIPIEIGQATRYARTGEWSGEEVKAHPDEIVFGTPQALTNGGVSLLWECAIGNGVATADQTLTFLSNARAALGVGDSATAFAATQNDLVAAVNKIRVAMDATYPVHADGTAAGNQTITFQSTFSTAQANWVWNEWVVANSATAATGRILNRKVEGLGTKVATATWTLQVTVTIS